jgi:hypothetical protein
MSYPLVLISWEEYKLRRARHEDLAGQCFYASAATQQRILSGLDAREASPEYLSTWHGKRPIIFVHLPGGAWSAWSPDCRSYDPGGPGWTVIGELPLITVEPSVCLPGIYHGSIRDGVISADVGV